MSRILFRCVGNGWKEDVELDRGVDSDPKLQAVFLILFIPNLVTDPVNHACSALLGRSDPQFKDCLCYMFIIFVL